MAKRVLALFGMLVLVACTQAGPPVQDLPDLTFKHLQPISLDVAAIEIVDQSKAGLGGDHVEHLFPTSPKQALNNWVRDRLVATGTSGLARLTIRDASAIEEKLDRTTGIKGIFTNDQSERYSTNLDVALELFDKNNQPFGFAEAKAGRFTTIAEKATLLEREKAWFELVEKMMVDFDKTMVNNMNSGQLQRR